MIFDGENAKHNKRHQGLQSEVVVKLYMNKRSVEVLVTFLQQRIDKNEPEIFHDSDSVQKRKMRL